MHNILKLFYGIRHDAEFRGKHFSFTCCIESEQLQNFDARAFERFMTPNKEWCH
jgi:hypothetical protein